MHNNEEFSPYLPFYTLLKKEILRFLSVSVQTILTPIITASLYLFIFGLSLGSRIKLHDDYTYIQFVVPGLILMGVINNAFANSSSSIFFSRYLGNIVDLLVTPLTPAQMIMAFTLAAVIRGLVVGACVLFISLFFTSLQWSNPLAALGMIVLASFLFSQLGIIAAIYSNSFDHLSMYNNFLLLPMIYLGGLFYPVSELPSFWSTLSHFNPIFFMIDGFRQSIIGHGDVNLGIDFAVTAVLSAVLFSWAAFLIHQGKKMRT